MNKGRGPPAQLFCFPVRNTGVYSLIVNKNDLPEVDMFSLIPDFFFNFPSISQTFQGCTCSAECSSSAVRAGLPSLLPATSQIFVPSDHLPQRDQIITITRIMTIVIIKRM